MRTWFEDRRAAVRGGVCRAPGSRTGRWGRRIAAAVALAGGLAGAGAAAGDEYSIVSPLVVRGENEVELQGYGTGNQLSRENGVSQYRVSAARGLTDNWALEVYDILSNPPGAGLQSHKIEVENQFQLVPMGEYWANFGLVQAVEIPTQGGTAYEFELMPIIEKQIGRKLFTFNLMFERSFGTQREHGTIFNYRVRFQYRLNRFIAPGLEFYGEPGPLGNFNAVSAQRHEAGPALQGAVYFNQGRVLYYSAAVLLGLTPVSSDTRFVMRLEYEFFNF